MRFIIPVAVLFIIGATFLTCTKDSALCKDNSPKSEYYFPDSVYFHRAGISFVQNDSTQDLIRKFEADKEGFIVKSWEINDSVTFRNEYQYNLEDNQIIKNVFIEGVPEVIYTSIYRLDDEGYIDRLIQRFDGNVATITEYSYDLEGHLSMIYFHSNDTQCKWLWRDGDLDKIVWGDGECIENYVSCSDYGIPFLACYYELPKLDVTLSLCGYYGIQPRHAIKYMYQTQGVNEDTEYIEIQRYEFDSIGLTNHQRVYQYIDCDSIDIDIHWQKVTIY